MTRGRDEHGVDDEAREATMCGERGHLGHYPAICQHAGLHAADLEVIEDGLDL